MHMGAKIMVRCLVRVRMGHLRHLTGEITHKQHGS